MLRQQLRLGATTLSFYTAGTPDTNSHNNMTTAGSTAVSGCEHIDRAALSTVAHV